MNGKSQSLRRFIWKSEAGYQMVELLVLLAVMSVIMAIGFPMYLSYARAQETDGLSALNTIGLGTPFGVFQARWS